MPIQSTPTTALHTTSPTETHSHRAVSMVKTSNGLLTLTTMQIKRYLSNWSNLFFSVGLPIVFYLIFGAAQDYGEGRFPHGNIPAFIMVGMALYGGVTAAVGSAGQTIMEHSTGWGRQLALTPMSTSRIVTAQAALVVVASALPVAAVFIVGALTGAEMQAWAWLVCYLICVLACLPFGFYGYDLALAIPKASTLSLASGSIVILSFIGNLFIPLDGTLLQIGRFTPLYGAAALTRYPLAEGITPSSASAAGTFTEPLWIPVVNVVAWTAILIAICVKLNRRDKSRV